jgi:hypothetical protein
MSPGATFERVYLDLRRQIVSGAFPPGTQLEPAGLAEGLVASITPVRDALHRLVGERLVHTPRNDGFRMPIYTEASIRDLYAWNLALLQLGLAAGGRADPSRSQAGEGDEDDDLAGRTARLFVAIARLSGSHEHEAAARRVNDRLMAIRLKETRLFDVAAEIGAIEAALDTFDLKRLRRLLGAYHRVRMKQVGNLLERLQPEL